MKKNLIDSIYESEKKKAPATATPLSTAFFLTSIVQDFQDSPDDEEDTRSSQEYLNDFEEEYQESALLAKSKRFFKKGSQRFSSTKATDDTPSPRGGGGVVEDKSPQMRMYIMMTMMKGGVYSGCGALFVVAAGEGWLARGGASEGE
ncbi:hypothetical protein Tco_0123286 [Tanacetum coccineum]